MTEYKIITREFNAQIGTRTKEEGYKSMRAFEKGERNERGNSLIEFTQKHIGLLVVTNTSNQL